MDSEWDFAYESENKYFNLNVNAPKSVKNFSFAHLEKLTVRMNAKGDDMTFEVENNASPKKISLQLTKTPDFDFNQGKVNGILWIDENKCEIKIEHAYENNRRFISGKMKYNVN